MNRRRTKILSLWSDKLPSLFRLHELPGCTTLHAHAQTNMKHKCMCSHVRRSPCEVRGLRHTPNNVTQNEIADDTLQNETKANST